MEETNINVELEICDTDGNQFVGIVSFTLSEIEDILSKYGYKIEKQ